MSAVAQTRWPDAVWDVAILRGLDARARSELEAAGKLSRVRQGDVLHRVGEPADAIHVVVAGTIALAAVRRGETDAAVIRRAQAGDLFGEEAILAGAAASSFAVRPLEARCERDATIAEVPIAVLRRALGRTGEGEQASRLERALRRAAAQDLLRTTAFTRDLPERDLEILLDAAKHVHVPRGEHVYRAGEQAEAAFFVADGLLQAQSDDDGKPRIEAYLSRGDLFGDSELEERASRGVGVVASGPAWLVAVPRDVFVVVARRNAALLERARRVRGETNLPVKLPGASTTAHVFKDLYRLRVARSLLVIDQDSCVRCGLCAWSCASVHDDGVSRLVRHGERMVVKTEEKEQAPLLVPNSCQHCQNPACMIDCPTGAIGRDARGEVFIREELCTGCGACAKACPWDNIALAPRPKNQKYPEVAVKCDLCSGLPSGPACVAACPTESIVRIDPNAQLVELGGKEILPRRRAAWPWVVGALAAACGLALADVPKKGSGFLVGALVVLLAGYSAFRRAPRIAARLRVASFSRIAYVAHLSLGALAFGATLAHAGTRATNDAGGALLLAMAVALASGAYGALAQWLVPRRLARLERKSVLPEELAARGKELDDALFKQLSGKAEVVKVLYAKVLRPYRRSRLGVLELLVSGRTLPAEEKRLRARIAALVEKRAAADDLVRTVVERRAIAAQAILSRAVRAWVPVHVAAAAISVVLLAAHVYGVLRR